MCNFFVSNHFAAVNRALESQSEDRFGGVFHLWQTVKLFLLSIEIYINCNIHSLHFPFHDTGLFEGAVKWRLKRIMCYSLPHSQDFMQEKAKAKRERQKQFRFCCVFKTFGVPLFWGLSLADVSRSEFRKQDFLNSYILNFPWSPLLSQWSVGLFCFSLVFHAWHFFLQNP